MKKRGIGIMGIIVFLGLLALIVWSLDYITTKDFVTIRTPITAMPTNNNPAPVTTATQNASSTPTTTPQQTSQTAPAATSTPAPVKTPATSPTASSNSSALTVTYTDKGFSPTSLAVKKGQTVTFVNNSSSKVWVAANPFPTSSEYPAFNEKTGMASGASWSFTFNNIGTWFYHNHYSQAQGAKIVVSP